MSSRNYNVTIQVKDGGVLKRLEAMNGGSGGRGGSSSSTAGGGGIMSKIEGLGVGQLLKLGGIAAALTTLVTLTVKSSGYLQQSFKLAETSMLLIFKPIGDFIGLALRPLTLMLLMWAIPFYKVAAPIFRDWGKNAGSLLEKGFNPKDSGIVGEAFKASPLNIDTTKLMLSWSTFLIDLDMKLKAFPNVLWGYFIGIADSIWNKLIMLPNAFWGYFIGIGDALFVKLFQLPDIFFGYFSAIGTSIYNGLVGVPQTLADVFTGLATNITTTLAGIPKAIYDAIIGWITSLGGAFGGNIGGNTNGPSINNYAGPRARTMAAGIAETVQ